MARPKRKTADTMESSTPRRSHRHATTSDETNQEPGAKRRKTPMRACKGAARRGFEQIPINEPKKKKAEPKVMNQLADTHPAATFKPPKNPRATFEGLPAELRLQIYELLSQSTMIHVHKTRQDGKPILDERDRTNGRIKFKWTPCRGTHPKTPLLCANPKWSAMCKEDDRCTYKIDESPPEPRGYWALAVCNKAIRRETKEPFFRHTVVSIHPDDLEDWMNYILFNTIRHFWQIRHVTLAGQDDFLLNSVAMKLLATYFPNLESVGLQCQSPFYNWGVRWDGSQWHFSDAQWANWVTLEVTILFDPSVFMAFEAMVWRSNTILAHRKNNPKPSMSAVRIFGRGKAGIHVDDDLFENGGMLDESGLGRVNPGWSKELVHCDCVDDPNKDAKWRAWWHTRATKGYSW